MTLETTHDELDVFFTADEWDDIKAACEERDTTPFNLIREAVLSDLVR